MEELDVVVAEPEKQQDPVELYRRNIRTMKPSQLRGHLRRKVRTSQNSMIDGTWAIVLSTVFDNTTTSGVGGKLVPYLR